MNTSHRRSPTAHHNNVVAEYMAFIRGIIVVVIQMCKSRVNFMFKHLFDQNKNNAEILKPHIDKVTFPEGMWQWKAGALASLAGIRSLCAGDDLKMKYFQMTEDMAKGLDEESPFNGSHPLLASRPSPYFTHAESISHTYRIHRHE